MPLALFSGISARACGLTDILTHYTWFDPVSGQLHNLSRLTDQAGSLQMTAGSILTAILSLICCFYGYRLSRAIMSLSGFIIGSFLGQVVICPLAGVRSPLTGLLTIVCGAVLASLAWKIYKVGLCMLAFFLTWSVTQLLIPLEGFPKLALCLFAGIAAAIFVLGFLRPGIILLTAVFGGTHASAGLLTAADYFHLQIPDVFSGILPLSAGLVAAGILVQFIMTRHDE